MNELQFRMSANKFPEVPHQWGPWQRIAYALAIPCCLHQPLFGQNLQVMRSRRDAHIQMAGDIGDTWPSVPHQVAQNREPVFVPYGTHHFSQFIQIHI